MVNYKKDKFTKIKIYLNSITTTLYTPTNQKKADKARLLIMKMFICNAIQD
jgi:hypothetical protein